MANPTRSDPTRTQTIRKKFERVLTKRFKTFQKSLLKLLVTDDVFGLAKKEQKILQLMDNQIVDTNLKTVLKESQEIRIGYPLPPYAGVPVTNAPNEWAFLSDENKLLEFERWIQQETGLTILPEDERFWEDFVDEGYKKGAGRAFNDVNKAGLAATTGTEAQAFAAGRKSQFIAGMLGAPETVEKTKLLASRVFTDLKGVTETMATQLRRELVDGLVQGDNPKVIARRMTPLFDPKKGRSAVYRARTIARTEIIRAHAEGQLDALERIGVKCIVIIRFRFG